MPALFNGQTSRPYRYTFIYRCAAKKLSFALSLHRQSDASILSHAETASSSAAQTAAAAGSWQ